MQVRVGRAPGAYRFQAIFKDLRGQQVPGSPATFTVTATAIPTGNIYTLVNLDRTSGYVVPPTPGPYGRLQTPAGMAVASDGTIYFTDYYYHLVKKLSKEGTLTTLAGAGSSGYTGDNGPAAAATLYNPTGIVLDEPNNRLYVSDTGNKVVRLIDLTTQKISTYAGGASIGQPGYGAGNPATSASFLNPHHLSIGPDGALYVADVGMDRIRRIDPGSKILTDWLKADSSNCTSRVTFSSCGSVATGACQLRWDSAGNAYLSGNFGGTQAGNCAATPGIVRVANAVTNSLTAVVGRYQATTSDGRPAVDTQLSAIPYFDLDADANIYLSNPSSHTIQRIDVTNGKLTTLAGNGTASFAGENSVATAAMLNKPSPIAVDAAGNLLFGEQSNFTLRAIAGGATFPTGGAKLNLFAGDGQTTPILQTAPQLLAVKLLDLNNAALTGYTVQWVSLDEGASVVGATSNTDANGMATMQARVGRLPGAYRFQASFRDPRGQPVAGSPVSFTVTATAIPTGNIYTLVNLERAGAYTAAPTPGPLARIHTPSGIAVASDGTIYFTDSNNHTVKKLSKEGTLTTIAGTGSAGYTGDDGAATAATLYTPTGIALDEANNRLYVADATNKVVRLIDLTTQKISTYAGGGSTGQPGYGAGNVATSANFIYPSHLSLDPQGALYVSDTGMDRIRRIDPETKVLTDWLKTDNSTCSSRVSFYTCSGNATGACQLRWDSAGNAYLSASLTGTVPGNCNSTPGIVRVDNAQTNALTLVAGRYQGATADGRPAIETVLTNTPYFDLDSRGNIYLSNPSSHTIQRIDVTNGRLTTLAGNGTASFVGENSVATAALLNKPSPIVVDAAGSLIFGEQSNFDLRAIAGGATFAGGGAKMELAGGDGQTVMVDQVLPQLFSVKLTDGASSPLVGYTVQWTVVDTGGGLYATSSKTDVNGIATALGRPGWLPGTYRFRASFTDLAGNAVAGSPVTFTVTAAAPASGTTFTVVNADHSSGNSGVPGPATMARQNMPRGMALGANGDVYIADYNLHSVRRLTKEGLIFHVAGSPSGSWGYTGDGGLAVNALLNGPTGLAYDALRNTLYIGDYSNRVVRAVSLTTGVITTVAGGGSAPSPGYGDSGPATSATLNAPTHVAIGPDDSLYITDIGHDRIRKVALSGPTAGSIVTWLDANTNACSSPVVVFSSCDASGAGSAGCHVVWDSLGNAYVSGGLAGAPVNNGSNCSSTPGIAMITPGPGGSVGTITAFAGKFNGSTAENVAANTALFSAAPTMALDEVGNVVAVELSAHRIRLIDTIGKINTVAGKGTAGYVGDYAAASTTQLSSPWMPLIVSGGHVLFSDGGNSCVREVW
jgi:sugar lactone lactonase YvrE